MIPILYTHSEKAFDHNGIGILSNTLKCRVVEGLNGTYELTLKYPITGIHYKEIVNRAIILAKPNPVSRPQPFRIYRRVPSSKGTIVVYARHIAYDLMGVTVSPFTATGIQSALAAIPANAVTECPFSFWSDKNTGSTLTVATPKDIWTLLGGSEGSVLDVYRGEYEFDRYTIKLWNRRGEDRGVTIRYGKNLTSLEQDENCASCYTGVYPYWADTEGNLVQLPEKIVYASGNYDHTRIFPLDLSDKWTEQPTEDQIRSAAESYIISHDIGTPAVSWKVEHVALEQTAEYKGMALLERVLLGDTVTIVFPDMDVSSASRVVETDFDVLLERYNSVTQGSLRANIADTLAHQKKELEKKPSQTLVQTMVATLTAGVLGAKGGAVRLLDTDGDGMPDELYIADNPDPALAVKVWRWNYEGWAASKTGYAGPFIMGATLDDGILANAVTAANLVAGTIKSKDGKSFFLDLDNGILEMQAFDDLVEDVDEELNDIRNTITEKTTSVLNDCESIIMTALESYVETGDYETFKKNVEAELKVVSNKITMDFTALTERITTVEGDAQSKLSEIYKHIQFDNDGITIGSTENAIKMNLDNDQLVFSKNGVEIVRLDIDNFTPTNVYIKSGGRLKLGNFAWEVLETGVPVFLKVGE